MQTLPIQATQNSNNSMIKPIEVNSQNQMNAIDAKAVAAPTPVVAGAPTQTQQGDSVELSNKKDKKFDKTLILAFGIGVLVSAISMIFRKKLPK